MSIAGSHWYGSRPLVSASPSTQSQDAYYAQAAAKSHVWVRGPVTAGVCVDVCGLCHLRMPKEPCEMKLEDHAELATSSLVLVKLTLPLLGQELAPERWRDDPHLSPQTRGIQP